MDVAFAFAPGKLRYNGQRFKVVLAFFDNEGRAVKLGDCARVAADDSGEVALRTLQALAQAAGRTLPDADAQAHALAFRGHCREAIKWRPTGRRDKPIYVPNGLHRGRINL